MQAAASPGPGSGGRKKAAATAAPAMEAGAAAAIAAVDEAVKLLPDESQVKFSVMAEGADAAGNDAAEPPNYGTKVGGWGIRTPHGAAAAFVQALCRH